MYRNNNPHAMQLHDSATAGGAWSDPLREGGRDGVCGAVCVIEGIWECILASLGATTCAYLITTRAHYLPICH
jgi:hypothetical protein